MNASPHASYFRPARSPSTTHDPSASRNVLIVDDEPMARSNLRLAMAGHADWRVVAECAGAAEARVALETQPVDLMLLDIRMPRQDGLAFVRELIGAGRCPLVVFVTAYDEHALAAFDVYALDYVLKPFDDDRFAAMLQRAGEILSLKDRALRADAVSGSLGAYLRDREAVDRGGAHPALSHLIVRSVGAVEKVAIADIEWIGAAGNYVELHLATRVVLHRSTLTALEVRLPEHAFMRVHRTALVRRDAMVRLGVSGDCTYFVNLASGATVAVSERYLKDVRRLFE